MKPFLHAEQALLGALLLDPAQMAPVTDWLTTEHFYRPAHRALYAALLRAHAQSHPALSTDADNAARLSWLSAAVDSADDRAVTAAYAHTLIAACPRTAHATSYARIVLEASFRRSLSEQAARLHQAASAGSLDTALKQADELIELILDLRDRWAPNAPSPDADDTNPLPEPTPNEAVDVVPSEEQQSEESFLLATLLDAPESMEELVDWLWPQDFAVPAHQRIYHCLGALHHRGEPVDAVTVLWEAERRGHLAGGLLTGEQVLGLAVGGTGAEAGYFGTEILRRALLRTAAISAWQIQRLGEQPTPAGRLLLAAFQAMAPLQQARRRWRTAGGSAAEEERTSRPGQFPCRHGERPARPSSEHPAARARARPLCSARPPLTPIPQRPEEPPVPDQDVARPDRQLLALARRVAIQREILREIGGGPQVPELTTVARALNQLAELVTDTSDEALFGSCEPLPHSDEHRATLYAYTLACRHAGEALGHLSGALEPLGMLYRTEEQIPPARDLRDGRERAVAEVFHHLSAADRWLRHAEEALTRRASQLAPRPTSSPSTALSLGPSSSPPPPPQSSGRTTGWGR